MTVGALCVVTVKVTVSPTFSVPARLATAVMAVAVLTGCDMNSLRMRTIARERRGASVLFFVDRVPRTACEPAFGPSWRIP
ncbi:hypothetical protein JCM2811A_29590 [Methylorubrum rhodinum]